MVHEKNKPMVQVHKRETLLHNKNRITHLKKKQYKKLHTITFLYIYALYVHIHVHSYT